METPHAREQKNTIIPLVWMLQGAHPVIGLDIPSATVGYVNRQGHEGSDPTPVKEAHTARQPKQSDNKANEQDDMRYCSVAHCLLTKQ